MINLKEKVRRFWDMEHCRQCRAQKFVSLVFVSVELNGTYVQIVSDDIPAKRSSGG